MVPATYPLGDVIGFVRLVEATKDADAAVVRAARVCYGSETKGPELDKKLIRFLLEHDHGTPFEHNTFTFHVKAPIFVFRQWHRHRIGVSYNEVSARFAEAKDEFFIPRKWRAQDTVNKQGSVKADLDHEFCTELAKNHCKESMARYRLLLEKGVAREMARIILPVELYSEMYFTCNARSMMAFLKLRSERHAQYETRQYANAIWNLWAPCMPWTAEAFLQTLDLQRYAATDGIAGPCVADLTPGVKA